MDRRDEIGPEMSGDRSDIREWTSPTLRDVEIAVQTENAVTINTDGTFAS